MPTGSCGCGAVRYEVTTPFVEMHHCHCSKCRKSHGAAFATFAQTREEGVRVTQGADGLREFKSSPVVTRRFCGTCGANLFFAATPFPGAVWVAAGTLDDDPGIRAGANAFMGSRADWYEGTDALACFDTYPPLTPASG